MVDMTYKVGPYYTTVSSFKHKGFANKNGQNPYVVGAVMTSVSRTEEDYSYLATQLREKANIETLIYGTDGELALEKGLEKTFPSLSSNSIHLRCFTHANDNVITELKKCGVREQERTAIGDSIFVKNIGSTRQEGLVDCNSLIEYEEKYGAMKRSWPQAFTTYMESKRF